MEETIKWKHSLKKIILYAMLALIIFLGFVFAWSHHVSSYLANKDYYSSYSPWGDSFALFNIIISFLNVIISFLSICGLIATIYLQIKNNREQSDNSEKQWRLSYKQNFDSNFYNFISALDKMKENIPPMGDILALVDEKIDEKLLGDSIGLNLSGKLYSHSVSIDGRQKTVFYERNAIFIESIFSYMKKVYESDLSDSEKNGYMSVLFSNLDDKSIILIGYYAIRREEYIIQDILGRFENVVNLLVYSSSAENINKTMSHYKKYIS